MQAEIQAAIAFHLIGKRPSGAPDAARDSDLRPALFAEYRDLGALRYDFPLALVRNAEGRAAVQSLSGVIDRVVGEIAGGADGERLRQHALRFEREIRALAADGEPQPLSTLADKAATRLAAQNDATLADSLKRIRAALKVDGDVVDCDKALPFRFARQLWKAAHEAKARAFRDEVGPLVAKLSDIMRVDFVRSEEGMSAERLEAAFGTSQRDGFDFGVLSRVLSESMSKASLPEARWRRIRWLLTTLKAQRFYPPVDDAEKRIGVAEPYGFAFDGCAEAIAAYRERLPKAVEVAKAIAMAKLEVDGSYKEARHDGFFEDFGANGLDPSEAARFPDYLVCVRAGGKEGAESELILRALAAGLPAKIVTQTDDLFEASPLGEGLPAFGLRSRQLVSAAISLGSVYVVQSASSNLYQFRDRAYAAMSYGGPALISVYSGAGGSAAGLSPYLAAAAAMDARAFPALTYDPSAGSDWASRFSLAGNAQPERDWPVHSLAYEDAAHQRQGESLAFTFVDFAACDRRFFKHFAKVTPAQLGDKTTPVAAFIASTPADRTTVPYVLMADADNQLVKLIVDDRIVREARRCAEMWRSLQELAGIRNSHAARALEAQAKAFEEERRRDAEAAAKAAAAVAAQAVVVAAAPAAAPTGAPAPVVATAPAEAAPARSPDEAYIETARCTTCNECTQINDKMFGYNGDKQASIVDVKAGTYRQLVEAAESCQVSIIHPGKPVNPSEPGLEELIERAKPFI